ncbi:MAG: YfhO family protein, partial [Clostridia bacterium]|nr:YfhO family protein [Clostridia bacterium]
FKKHPNAKLLIVALSVLYAYSGYTMMYYQNLIWLDIAYLFPLLLLGLEGLKEGKRGLFIAVLSASMIINYYLGYMLVVFLLLYAFVWVVIAKDKRFAGNFILCCGVSALISAVVWLPSLLQYFTSGRTTSIVENLRDSGLITPYETALPTVFSILFLIPFALGVKREEKDVKMRWLLFIATLIPLFIEPIAKMWQTGSYMSFPTRYAFITIFLGLTLAFDGLQKEKKFAISDEKTEMKKWEKVAKNIGRYALNAFLPLLGVWYFFFSRSYVDKNVETLDQYATTLWGNKASFEGLLTLYVVAFAVGLTGYLLYRFRLVKPVCLWVAVSILVLSELYVAPSVYILPPSHEVNWLQDVVETADWIEDDGFYRVKSDKEYSSRDFDVNVMGALGYNALGHYTSLTGEDYMKTVKRLGYTSYWMEVGNSGGTILSDALLSVKYEISSQKTEETFAEGNYYGVSKTPLALSLGIITAEDIVGNETLFEDRASFQKTLYKDFFGTEDGVTVYGLNDAILSNLEIELKDDRYVLKPQNGNGKLTFTVTATELESLYFNVFDENTNALRQQINGKFTVTAPKRSVSSFPSQKNNGLLHLGDYEAGKVTVTVRVGETVSVSELGLVSIRKNQLLQDGENLQTLGLKTGKNSVFGEYTAKGGECVFLSIPYDSGMRLKINGKKAELYRAYEGFTAFYLEEGVNEIEIKFAPKGFVLGVLLCGVALGLCGTAIALWLWKKKRVELPVVAEKIAYVCVAVAGVAVVAAVYVIPIFLCLL